MKRSPIILFAVLLAVPRLCAQLVNDGATNILANVTNILSGGVVVGTNGSFTLLVLSNNCLLTNSANGIISLNATAKSNEVRLVGPNARWLMGGSLYVGDGGAFNRLLVSNGGMVRCGQVAYVGNLDVSASNNSAVVTGPGSSWSVRSELTVGWGGSNNRLEVSNGGQVGDDIGNVGISGSGNQALVTGANSIWSNRFFSVGGPGAGNQLVVSNGGWLLSALGNIGYNEGTNNLVVVTGADSTWSNRADLLVGRNGSWSQLVVSNAGTAVTSNLFVGSNAPSTNNRLTVDGGTLRVTNASAMGVLDIRRGTNVLNAGLIEADQLLVTNTLGMFEFNGGVLSVKNSTVNNNPPLRVGNGVSPATLQFAGNGNHVYVGGLIVSSNAVVTGNGSLFGPFTVQAGGLLSPGTSIGKISGLNVVSPVLQGTTLMEISKNGTTLTNDQFQWTFSPFTYGGALIVSNLNTTALATGDEFKLFDASGYVGSFQSISLPPLGPGLKWVTNLQANGSIGVFATPAVGAGFALSFDGTNNFVEVSNDSRFNAYPLVATAWINTTQGIGEVGIINKYLAGSFNGWHVGLLNGEVRAWYARDNVNYVGNPGSGVNGGPVNDGAWHHVAFTVDNTGGRLYVDGFLKQTSGWVGTRGSCTTTQALRLARYPGGAGEFFQGTMDEVAIWSGVEQDQPVIKTNLTRGLIGSEPGLVLYHRNREGTKNFTRNAANATGDFASGILQNGVVWVPGLILRPAILTKRPAGITSDTAILKGIANPGLTNASAWFEWGETTNYGNVTAVQPLGNADSNTNFNQSLSGLTENTTYHYRAVASNGLGISFGLNASFIATSTNLITPRNFHTATLLPNGKVLITGGTDLDGRALSSSELFDPITGKVSSANPMGTARYQHTATYLSNGKVLVAGGQGDYPALFASAELYDPNTGLWTPTGPLSTNRYTHTATLLTNGKVLVTGGTGSAGVMASTEIYDPATGNWTTNAPLGTARYFHSATLLTNGEVLVTGGLPAGIAPALAAAERFNPATGTWSPTGPMTTNRYAHSATLLPDGKVLVVGGSTRSTFLSSAELYDPNTGTWAATGSMLNYRFGLTATLLPNGRVFAAGNGIGVPSLYNPLTGTWTDVPGPDPASFATATLLPNGNVFVAGGLFGIPWPDAQIYAPSNSGTWTATAPMANARDGHTATLLPNGRVLVASFTNSEIYNPLTGTWSNTAALNSGRNNHTATLLPNGKVMVAGGINFVNTPGVELYDMTSGSWSNTAPLITNRIGGHTATLLPNGRVLVVGGNGELFAPPMRNAELYDFATGTWTSTGLLTTNRSGHLATLLPNGKVLVTGGFITGGFFPSVTSSAELYDPFTGLWTVIPSMSTNRSGHIAVPLPSGKVLIAGGAAASLLGETASAELYDPATGTWKATGSMIMGRSGCTATLLPNGKVVVAAGYNANAGGYLSSAELYDPTTGNWTATASLGAAHNAHTGTLLPTGKVLVTGGYFGNGNTNRAELYDVGLGFSNSWRPQITAISSPINLGGNLVITGAQFRGLSGGSSGSSQDSPTDYPLVQLRSLESQWTRFVSPTNWTTNSLISAPVTGLSAGWAMATVFVNGIPGQSALVSLLKPTAVVTLSNLFQYFDGTARSVSVSTVPPGLFVSVTYNGSPNAPTNIGSYSVVGTIIDPNYESTPVTNTLVIAPLRDFGADVSHFQNESGVAQSAWNQMFAEGKRFVFIKATEGLTGPHDATMTTNVARAAAAGLQVGVYHFAHPENRPTTNGAILEASNMVVYAGSAIGPGRLRPVLDLEGSAATLNTTALTDWAIAFCNEIVARRGPGATPIIYCNQTFANNELDSRLANYDLWLRTVGSGANPAVDNPPGIGFADATGVFNDWSFWQYSSTGSSGGISPLDLNVCHSEFKPLESFLITNVAPTTIQLTTPSITLDGNFQFSFSNVPGAIFTVMTTTNVALPLSAWTILDGATETSPGLFQFTDMQATNHPQRYYRVRSP